MINPISSSSYTPRWVQHMPDLNLPSNPTIPDVVPTLLIGIGPTARQVLQQLAKHLKDLYGRIDLPGIRLLQIELEVPGALAPNLVGGEILSEAYVQKISPRMDSVEKNIKSPGLRHIRWWYSAGLDMTHRPLGRIALINDVLGGLEQSRVYSSLHRILANESIGKMYVIASAADSFGSCIAFDMALLAKIASDNRLERSSLVLFMNDVRTGLDGDQYDREARTLASLDELDRLQHNRYVHFNYNLTSAHATLRRNLNNSIFDKVLVVHGSLSQPNMLGNADPVISATANVMLAMLNQRTETPVSRWVGGGERVDNTTLVTLMTASAFHIPLRLMTEVLRWRMVEHLVQSWRHQLMGNPNTSFSLKDAFAWLSGKRGSNPLNNEFLRWLADVQQGERVFMYEASTVHNASSIFSRALIEQVARLLNNEDPLFQVSSGCLLFAIEFVEQVTNSLRLGQKHIERTGTLSQTGPVLQAMIQTADVAMRQLNEWQKLFRSSGLAEIIDERLNEVRDKLTDWGRDADWKQQVWSEDSEELFFKPLKLHEMGKPSATERAMQLTGWIISQDEFDRPQLCFAVYPPKFGIFTGRERDMLLQALDKLAGYFIQGPEKRMSIAAILESSHEIAETVSAQLTGYGRHAIESQYDIVEAAKRVAAVPETSFLITGDARAGQLLAQGRSNQFGEILASGDRETVLWLRLRNNVPLAALTTYQTLRSERAGNDSHQHVFEAESLAARATRKLASQKFSKDGLDFDAEFRSILHDGQLLELFARAAILGWIRLDESGQIVLEWEEVTEVLSVTGSWEQALRCFCLDWPANKKLPGPLKNALIDAIDRASEQDLEWPKNCESFMKDVIMPMKGSSYRRVAWILDVIITDISN